MKLESVLNAKTGVLRMDKRELRLLFRRIERRFDMPHACGYCFEWCDCWGSFKKKELKKLRSK